MVVFSDIMSETLKPWEDRSLQARTRAAQMDVTAKGMENTISKLQGNLEQLNNTDYSKQIKDFEDSKKESLEKAKVRWNDLLERENSVKVDLRIAMKERAKVQMAQKNFKSVISKKEYQELKDKKEKARDLYYVAKSQYEALEKDLSEMLGTVKGGISTCPVCKQAVDKKLLKGCIDECEKEMAFKEVNYNEYGTMLRIFGEEINKLDQAIQKETAEKSNMESQLRVLQSKIDGINKSIEYAAVEIKRQEINIKDIEKTKNNYTQLEKERKDDIKRFKLAIKGNEDLLGEAKKEFDAYTYWIKGFREIRLLLMVDALKEFEVSINNNLSKFGMGDWNVKLDIDQENKSGTIRKGFSVLVESPNHNGFVPFEVWSGGEGQRLRMAGTVGLMDLIQAKRQVDFGLEIFDEPTAWLSDKGIDDLCQALYYRAKENEKKIFLIDHKNLNTFGGFHGTINVVKDEKGSHVC
jgi:hypothetical protein